jgi:hypothetical protein
VNAVKFFVREKMKKYALTATTGKKAGK